ncbi:Ras guanine nucleotide exchange factor, putative [Entamoeba histolytica HM-1:IMSS-B]|uniref:Ras guanine nucleotide exchange factor, putative n=6 Tax=Entamoeba histolytica TaxID=5759 RepID=C4LY62_ENTH1|nr:Ras guanine nucleotide exchange factor, putative [Entamoeba histolytica HM-1:IMSS]EMD43346.1 Ras guanine nucleotide exchange factor, putative [Entamoeba histolytica KU27]EMH75641.1 Ras guanine nucleotide exchange factor, putative [Entamoeba histolytica HM-1:IMSS-B]EMS17749.1 Ras guanine nucleotide exchange factor, putative [Entamoeba histolytica HM-3:IMSS]ENY60707.1 Ras guanine nucleotide exchange factor, putative [Entamoeba histolytica HM-1:IMSS-A]GAT93729.1 Ras guanine nucleotide exchange|eukprot:XP_651290.1 Ras guanine nucleotide exchange factor, putative [Entamoeba histolytica HM-1:IMSS]
MKKFVSSMVHLKISTCEHHSKVIHCPVCGESICLMCFEQSVEVNGRCPLCKQLIPTHDLKQIKNLASGVSPYSMGKGCDSPRIKESDYHASPKSFLFDIPTTNKTITFTYEKGSGSQIIRYATLEKCLQFITSCDGSDIFFSECFILVHPLVVSSSKLMELLIIRFNPTHPQGINFETFLHKVLIPIRLKVMGLLRMWIQNRKFDFQNEKLYKQLDELMKKNWAFKPNLAHAIQVQIDKEIESPKEPKLMKQKSISSIDCSISPREYFGTNSTLSIRSCQGYESKVPSISIKSDRYSKSSFSSLSRKKIQWFITDFNEEIQSIIHTLFCFSPFDCAKQLSLKQMELLQKIELDEFLKQGWMKKEKENLAPNLLKMVRFSNNIINVVQKKILELEQNYERAFAIRYFISVAHYLKQLNNFDGMKAVLAGLESCSIYRLKESWGLLSIDEINLFKQLDSLISPDNNFCKMRELVKLASPPSIPFIGSILTDLVYTDDGNKSSEGKMINFYKVRSIGIILMDLQTRQKATYPFILVPKILKFWCCNEKNINENELFNLSQELEPTQTQSEISKEKKKILEKSSKRYEFLWKSFTKAVHEKE